MRPPAYGLSGASRLRPWWCTRLLSNRCGFLCGPWNPVPLNQCGFGATTPVCACCTTLVVVKLVVNLCVFERRCWWSTCVGGCLRARACACACVYSYASVCVCVLCVCAAGHYLWSIVRRMLPTARPLIGFNPSPPAALPSLLDPPLPPPPSTRFEPSAPHL